MHAKDKLALARTIMNCKPHIYKHGGLWIAARFRPDVVTKSGAAAVHHTNSLALIFVFRKNQEVV